MAKVSADRRRLLLSAVSWVGAIAGIAGARRAEALEMVVASPQSSLGLAYGDRCRPDPTHASLIEQLKRELAADASASSVTVSCPLCSCPVTVSR
jgi:hypothetical protein